MPSEQKRTLFRAPSVDEYARLTQRARLIVAERVAHALEQYQPPNVADDYAREVWAQASVVAANAPQDHPDIIARRRRDLTQADLWLQMKRKRERAETETP